MRNLCVIQRINCIWELITYNININNLLALDRSFIHTFDVSSAVDIILHKGEIGEIYNIGSEVKEEKSVIDVTKLLVKLIKNDNNYTKYIEYVEDRPFNDKRYFITNNKIKELGWRQIINFNDGIQDLTSSE